MDTTRFGAFPAPRYCDDTMILRSPAPALCSIRAVRNDAPEMFGHYGSKDDAVQRDGVVAIMLGTYNGERFLAEQLESISRQTHRQWVLWASDDGSTDNTLDILRSYQQRWPAGRLQILLNDALGATRNFMSLVHNPDIQADYYAYCDQDDIWESDKLERALDCLRSHAELGSPRTPALYCSRTRYVDARNHELGFSQRFRRAPSFANALMQNIAGGNTMVFNHAACCLLRNACPGASVVIHDWWTYIVISGCGGTVIYDCYPSVRYRQHEDNVIGMNANWPARLVRIRKLFQGQFRQWNEQNLRALEPVEPWLTPHNRDLLVVFRQARQRWLLPRLVGLLRSGVYRQTLLGNLGLAVAGVFHKL